MTGLFRGLLEIVNLLGGTVLFILVGSKAWAKSRTGRNFRLTFGGLVIGIVAAVVTYYQLRPMSDPSPICCVPVGLIAAVFGLELIRKALEDDWPEDPPPPSNNPPDSGQSSI